MRVELKASGGHYYKHTAIINCDSGVILGSGCATVDRVVALDIRGPGFKSSHSKSLSNNYYTIYLVSFYLKFEFLIWETAYSC